MIKDKDASFEAYLKGFAPVELPDGVSQRVLAPALALADAIDKGEESSQGKFGDFLASFFLFPIRALVLSAALVGANLAADANVPCLTRELAVLQSTAELPVATQGVELRGWFVDVDTVKRRSRKSKGGLR